MHLSEITLLAQYIDEASKGSFINNIYRSNGGVLIKLFGCEFDGIYYNSDLKVFFPVKDIKKHERQTITRIEEGLRANFSGRIISAGVKKSLGKVVFIETIAGNLILPLFKRNNVYIEDHEKNVIWKEHENVSQLKEMPCEMRHMEPVSEDPFYYENKYLEELENSEEILRQKSFLKKKKKLEKLLKKLKEEQSAKADIEKESLENAAMIRNSLYLFDPNVRKTEVEVYNNEGTQVKIPLDPKITVVQNMEKMFKTIKKLKAGKEHLIKRINIVSKEISDLSIEDISINIEEQKGRKNQKQQKRVPYHRFESDKGRVFLVGKDSKDNDELTFKIASMHDMWFHAKDHAGSHVVMRQKRNETIQADDLLTGCVLALMYSKAKKGMTGEVWYTQRKNVMKKKGMASGKVIIKNGKSKYITDGALSEKVKKLG